MNHDSKRRRSAFTLVEMLLVVSLIVILISILLPALTRGREMSERTICQNNLRQLGVGLYSYATDNVSKFPVHDSHNGNWMWDLTYQATDEIASRSNNTIDYFYCPSNTDQSVDGLWNFNPSFRVTGYFFTIKRYSGPMASAPDFFGGERWLRTVRSGIDPSQSPLVTDGTISASGDFTRIQGGWSVPHYSAHLNRATSKPNGGNRLYLDNHVDWRDFEEMGLQFIQPEHWF